MSLITRTKRAPAVTHVQVGEAVLVFIARSHRGFTTLFTAGSKGGPQELFSQLCALVHSEVQSASSYKNLKGNFMTHYLNMHTVCVATVVTFGVVLGLLMVSSLRAGFLLALAENAMVRPEPVYPVAAEDGRSLSDIICPNPLRLRTLLPERSGFCS